jgi:hypothetical protein
LVHGAAEAPVEHAITRRPPAVRTTRGAGGGTTEEGPPGEDVLEEVPDDGAPEGEDEANAEGKTRRRARRRVKRSAADGAKRKPINYGREDAEEAEKSEEGEEGEDEAPAPPRPNPRPAPTVGGEPRRKAWPVVVAAVVVLLLAGGGGAGAYFWFTGGKGTAKPKKEVAKSPATSRAAAPAATARQPEPPGKGADTPADKPPVEAIKLSAARLAAELAAAPAEASAKYDGHTLEVSGLFDKLEQEMQSPGAGPPQQHPVFAAEGAPVRCDLEGAADVRRWQGVPHGQAVTVRGVYSSQGGSLQHCELLPLTAPADAHWKGKEFELSGFADAVMVSADGQAFPTIQLEPETNGHVALHCLFRKTDEEEVRKLRPGTPVTVRGTCGGREHLDQTYRVRMDNCQFVYTTAPTPPTPRIEAALLLREYEEDLRRDLLPAPGTEERLDSPLPIAQLAREFTGDGKALEKKYRYKLLTVSGRVRKKVFPQGLVLESENTDQTLQVSCWFGKHAFTTLDEPKELTVRGLCTGLQDAHTLRLDDCEPLDPAGKADRRRLTADFLPHKPGRVLTFDLAQARSAGRGELNVVRQVFYDRDNGLTETVVTHTGSLAGSLFDKGEQGKWAAQAKAHKVRLAGPVYQHRVSPELVEVGQQALNRQRQVETVWEPALKIGARVGDSWKWFNANTEHVYTLEKFDERQGRPCAVVKEVVVTNGDERRPSEVRHVYVQDFGEVERRETLRLASGEQAVLAEKKLVEDVPAGPPGDKPGNR